MKKATEIKNVEYIVHQKVRGRLSCFPTVGALIEGLDPSTRMFDGSDFETDLYEKNIRIKDFGTITLDDQEWFIWGSYNQSAIIFQLA